MNESGLSSLHTNQVTIARQLGFSRIGKMKYFKKSNVRRECYGFVTIPLVEGELDVHVHIEGQYSWAFDGSDTPIAVKESYPFGKATDVFLTEPIDNGGRFRSERWIISNVLQFETVLRQIRERPVWRVWHNGAIALTTADFNELLHRFPVTGKHVSYPVGEVTFDRREWNDDEWFVVDDPRVEQFEKPLPPSIGFTHEYSAVTA